MLYSGNIGHHAFSRLPFDLGGTAKGFPCVCDERQLLTGARQLDANALAQIHDCFYSQIYRYARYRTGNAQVAEDGASEVFVRLLDALQNGNAPRKSPRGWLFGTASHIVNDHLRRHYRSKLEDLSVCEALTARTESDPEHQLQLSLSHDALRGAMALLTVEQQHVITLRFGQGLAHREVAQLLGKSEGAVKLLQLRALRALRRILESNRV